jgi:2',3'-cyclic-nucleotide 2'-phosphodiesterase/3'-nucleotidase/5'-nucleotidase
MRYHCNLALSALLAAGAAATAQDISLELLGRYESGLFAQSAAEIVAHDPQTQQLFAVNAASGSVDVLSIADPAAPALVGTLDVSAWGAAANSVAVHDGLVAVAVEAAVKTDPGSVVFFDAAGAPLGSVRVGALPDMLAFTPDGRYLLAANEGEPNDDYTVDPEGSVSVISIPADWETLSEAEVRAADFRGFRREDLEPSVRIFGPGATVAQDMEPEYIAVSADSTVAWVACQENNALAMVDIAGARVTKIVGLGFKDHSLPGAGIDASNRDSGVNIASWPVFGVYMPDALAAFSAAGRTWVISANEGDARDYDGFSEEARVGSLTLDPAAFPNAAELQRDEHLGRLNITTTLGDTDGDGDYDALYAYGARSFSIWDDAGRLAYDSGDDVEQVTATAYPDDFNSNNDENDSFDARSDDKGPEPEAVAVGVFGDRVWGFIGLERIGGIMVYELTDPTAPRFVQYLNTRDFAGDPELGTAGDLGPEGFAVIAAADSPVGAPLLVVGHEISGTTTIYRINGTTGDCYTDCDGGGSLDFFDFLCFQSAFSAGDLYADCDGSGELDLSDLLCFETEFGAGCP